MTNALALTQTMLTPEGRDKRDGNPDAIYAVVMDDSNVHCMTESMLDAWWLSLSPAEKGDTYERILDADPDAELEAYFQSMRNPLARLVAAGEEIVARYSRPMQLDPMPTFSARETAHLRSVNRCKGNHNFARTPETA